jgi:hypothetical protein
MPTMIITDPIKNERKSELSSGIKKSARTATIKVMGRTEANASLIFSCNTLRLSKS